MSQPTAEVGRGASCIVTTDEGCIAAGGADGELRFHRLSPGDAETAVLLGRVSCVGGVPSSLLWLPSLRGMLTIERWAGLQQQHDAEVERVEQRETVPHDWPEL